MAHFYEDNASQDVTCKNCARLQEEVKQCLKERDEHLQGWQRAKADYANYKKEEVIRTDMLIKFSNEMLVKDLLSIFDSLDLGLQAMKGDEAHEKGLLVIMGQFEDVLRRHGLERVNAKPGEALDLARHEPLVEVNSEYPPGMVVEEVASGFSLHGKIVRPVRVKISKGQNLEMKND